MVSADTLEFIKEIQPENPSERYQFERDVESQGTGNLATVILEIEALVNSFPKQGSFSSRFRIMANEIRKASSRINELESENGKLQRKTRSPTMSLPGVREGFKRRMQAYQDDTDVVSHERAIKDQIMTDKEHQTPWTRGPWEVMDGNAHHGPFIVESGGNVVADCYTRESDNGDITQYPELHCGAEAYANTRLIAKAPELIEALRESTALLDDFADLYERNEGSDTAKRTREFLRRNRALLDEIEEKEND